jgi:hypothetical protein
MAILSGAAPIEAGIDLMAPDVVAHVDGWHFQGINVWANWIQYLRTRGRVDDLTLIVDALAANADATVTARGRWSAVRGDRRVISKSCAATYRVDAGRIVEIWSTRYNYALICGRHVERRSGFAAELLRAWWWKTRAPQLDLTAHPRAPSLSFLSQPVSGGLLAPAE